MSKWLFEKNMSGISYIAGIIICLIVNTVGTQVIDNPYQRGYNAGYKAQYNTLVSHKLLKPTLITCVEFVNGKCVTN